MKETSLPVVPLADARAGLSATLRNFRSGADLTPVVIGAHRRPEAVVLPVAEYDRLASARSPVTVDRLRELSAVIRKLADAASLTDVRVFGSVARGDATEQSDVDLLVTPTEGTTLFDIAQFEIDIEAILGRPVSAVPITALDDRDRGLLDASLEL